MYRTRNSYCGLKPISNPAQRFTRAGATLLAFSLLSTPAWSSAAESAAQCEPLLGTASATATSPNTAAGPATFTLAGKRYYADIELTFNLGAPGPDGVSAITANHYFKVRNKWGRKLGTLSTSDTGTVGPTAIPGLLNLDLSFTVVSGTGLFEHVTGTMVDRGYLNVAAQPAVSAVGLAGSLCGFKTRMKPVWMDR
jgi:hypothetical protein